MMRIGVTLTYEEYDACARAAARDQLTIEQWAYCCLVADARADERRSPRRDPGAQDRPTTTTMVKCGHCGIETRAVARCDNCDTRLR